MKKRQVFILGLLSFLFGWLVRNEQEKRAILSPEQALEHAKDAFKQQAPISGSWIYMIPEDLSLNGLVYTGYRGGISRQKDDTSIESSFFVDQQTGAVFCTDEHADEYEVTKTDEVNVPVSFRGTT